jgi:hypothetical protein
VKIIVTQGGTTLVPGQTYCIGQIVDLLPLLRKTLVPLCRTLEADEVLMACRIVFADRPDAKIVVIELGHGTPEEGLSALRERPEIRDFEANFLLPKSWYEPTIGRDGRVYGVAGDFAAVLREIHGDALSRMESYQFDRRSISIATQTRVRLRECDYASPAGSIGRVERQLGAGFVGIHFDGEVTGRTPDGYETTIDCGIFVIRVEDLEPIVRDTPIIDAAVLAAYEASPEYDGGEARDGFHLRGEKLSWSQWFELDPDIAEDFRRRVIAGVRSVCPKEPPADWIEVMAQAVFPYTTKPFAASRNDLEAARAVYCALPLWAELWSGE